MRTFRDFKILKINIGRGVQNILTNVTGDSSNIDVNIKIKLIPDRDVMDGRDVVAVLVLEEHPEVVGVELSPLFRRKHFQVFLNF